LKRFSEMFDPTIPTPDGVLETDDAFLMEAGAVLLYVKGPVKLVWPFDARISLDTLPTIK
jgi:hypothetical protein